MAGDCALNHMRNLGRQHAIAKLKEHILCRHADSNEACRQDESRWHQSKYCHAFQGVKHRTNQAPIHLIHARILRRTIAMISCEILLGQCHIQNRDRESMTIRRAEAGDNLQTRAQGQIKSTAQRRQFFVDPNGVRDNGPLNVSAVKNTFSELRSIANTDSHATELLECVMQPVEIEMHWELKRLNNACQKYSN